MPIANRPMMEHVIDLLRRHGLTDIVVTLAFMPDAIRTYFGDGTEFGVNLEYVVEESPLGTAGSVRNAAHLLDETFLVISGDVLTDIDLGAIVKFHEQKAAMATIALTAVENPLEFGIVITNEDSSIERFLEKPTWGEVFTDTINTGIFVLEPSIFDYISTGAAVDFSGDVFPKLLKNSEAMFGALAAGYWEDVGTLDAYMSAHQDVLDRRVQVDIAGFEVSDGVWLGHGSELDPAAKVEGPVIIGEACRVEAGATVGQYTVLGTDVRVRSGAELTRAVVHSHTHIGPDVTLDAAVVGRNCDLRKKSRCEEGAVLGDECFIGEHSTIGAGVMVYPGKTVETRAVVNESIIWESRGAREVFGPEGVTGLANLDLTPQLAVRVAHAWGSTMPRGSTVVTSRDTSRAARMLKRALMAGLNAAGIDVLDLEVASVPMSRVVTRWPEVSGGISVRLLAGDAESVTMRFMGRDGMDLDEDSRRKVERVFQRQDYRRAMGPEIGEIRVPPRVAEIYASSLESLFDMEAIRAARFKIVIDYSYGSAATAMTSVLAKLGAEVLAINSYGSTAQAVETRLRHQAKAVARLVSASGADLGAIVGPDGERLTLVDARGRVLSDEKALFALALLTVRTNPGVVALPLACSSSLAPLILAEGGEIRLTKLSHSAVMAAATIEDVVFAGTLEGRYIRPKFLPAPDAAAALLSLLEALAGQSSSLESIVDELPPSHVVHKTVATPWEAKGSVMRNVLSWAGDAAVDLLDGVKVSSDRGWVLTMLDPQEPLTHVWAEGATSELSRALVQEQVERISGSLG